MICGRSEGAFSTRISRRYSQGLDHAGISALAAAHGAAGGTLIELGPLHPDPRFALRESPIADQEELRELMKRLDRLDSRAVDGPWTRWLLEVLHLHPGFRAGELCRSVGQEKQQFQLNVRKLKEIGLTESLTTGCRLSKRGRALLEICGNSALKVR